jgi:hypothetical protein
MQTVEAFCLEAVPPLRGALARHSSRLRGMRNRLTVGDALDEQQTAMERATGTTVRDEGLSVVVMRQTPQQSEVFTYVKPSPTS